MLVCLSVVLLGVLYVLSDDYRVRRERRVLADLDRTRPKHRAVTCYLIAWVVDGSVVRVATYSAPPWALTRSGGEEALLIYEARGLTYADARAELRAAYPLLAPKLSALHPFPGGES